MADRTATEADNTGTVEQVTGVVVDVVFPDELPEIYSALEIDIGPRRRRPS